VSVSVRACVVERRQEAEDGRRTAVVTTSAISPGGTRKLTSGRTGRWGSGRSRRTPDRALTKPAPESIASPTHPEDRRQGERPAMRTSVIAPWPRASRPLRGGEDVRRSSRAAGRRLAEQTGRARHSQATSRRSGEPTPIQCTPSQRPSASRVLPPRSSPSRGTTSSRSCDRSSRERAVGGDRAPRARRPAEVTE